MSITPSPESIQSSPKTVTFTASFAIANAIKTSIATSTAAHTYSTTALNGSIGTGTMFPAQTISVTTTSSTGSYNATDAIVFTGKDINGKVISESLTLTSVDGGETTVGVKGFASVTSIAVPAQVDVNGHFTFGVRDLVCNVVPRQIRATAAGNLKVGYNDSSTDVVPFLAAEKHDIEPTKIFGDASTTVVGMTLFF